VAHMMISHFVDHLPYYRLEGINARSGRVIQTVGGQIKLLFGLAASSRQLTVRALRKGAALRTRR
jgi:hypothetical protein